jgi:hypothetical protein
LQIQALEAQLQSSQISQEVQAHQYHSPAAPNPTQSQYGPTQAPFPTDPTLHHDQNEQILILPNPPLSGAEARPAWLLGPIDNDQVIYPTSLFWNVKSHEQKPQWVTRPHSAVGLSKLVCTSTPVFEANRYNQLPRFRSLPIDGVNTAGHLSIGFKDNYGQENIRIHTRVGPYKKEASQKVNEITSEAIFPLLIFNRFIVRFYEVCDKELGPLDRDVFSDPYVLYSKEFKVAQFQYTFTITCVPGPNGSERLVSVQTEHLFNPPHYAKGYFQFPWIHMMEVLKALRAVHLDLQHDNMV